MRSRIAGGEGDSRLAAVFRVIADNLSRAKLTVSFLAAECGISPRTLRTRLHDATGCSPKQYIEHARLRKAEYLLANSSLSVKEVMAEVGLADASHFSRNFRKLFGVPPSQYRKGRARQPLRIEQPREDYCSYCPLFAEMANRLPKRPTDSTRQISRRGSYRSR